MNTRLPIMFAHDGSIGLLYFMPFLILWLVGEFYAVLMGISGVIKVSFKRYDSLRLGIFPFLFGLVSLAFFLFSKWNWLGWRGSIFYWLSAVPSVLGLATLLRPVNRPSAAEPGAAPNGGPAKRLGGPGTGGGPPSVS